MKATGIILVVVFGEGFPEEMVFSLNPEGREGGSLAKRPENSQEWGTASTAALGGSIAWCVHRPEGKIVMAGGQWHQHRVGWGPDHLALADHG